MGRVCAAVNCTSRQKKDSGISFHEFPHKRPEVLKKWLQNVRRAKWFPREKSSFLCSKHFLPDCFEGGRQTLRRLRDDAIPTVFDYTVKPRKRKLSAKARVKRLAASSSSVITGFVKRNHPQMSASQLKPAQKIKPNPVRLLNNKTTNETDHSLQDIENRSIPRRRRRMISKNKSPTNKEQEQEEEEEGREDLKTDDEIHLSEEENPTKYNVLRAIKISGHEDDEIEHVNVMLHQSLPGKPLAGSSFQTVTIVPTVTSENGDVSYRLLVQDCVDDDSGTDVSMETLNTKIELGSSQTIDRPAQRLPSNEGVDEDKNRPMKCSYCNYVTQKRYLLSRHLKTHLERHPHQCDRCPFSFKTLLALQNHVNTHRGIRPFRCRHCSGRFTTSSELVTHMHDCHEEGREMSSGLDPNPGWVKGHRLPSPYHCPLCSYVGKNALRLRRHLLVHSTDELYNSDAYDVDFDSRRR